MPITQGQGNPKWNRDETLLALDVLLRHLPSVPGKQSQEVLELSTALRSLGVHPLSAQNSTFRNTAGVYLKLQNLYSVHPGSASRKGLKVSKTDREIWEEFCGRPDELRQIAEAIRMAAREIDRTSRDTGSSSSDEDEGSYEGRVLWTRHRIRERDRTLRRKKLKQAEASGGVKCEACDLALETGSLREVDEAVFEVHHVLPLCSSGGRATRMADLAVLCANCHRRLHALARIRGCPVPCEI